MRPSAVFPGRPKMMRAGWLWPHHLDAESTCHPRRESFSARKLGLRSSSMLFACIALCRVYEQAAAVQGQFPQVLVNQYSTDVPLTVNDVRKVVTAKLKAQAKQAAKGCT